MDEKYNKEKIFSVTINDKYYEVCSSIKVKNGEIEEIIRRTAHHSYGGYSIQTYYPDNCFFLDELNCFVRIYIENYSLENYQEFVNSLNEATKERYFVSSYLPKTKE